MAIGTSAQKKNLNKPDEVRELPKMRAEIVKIDDHTMMRATFQPGWRWSDCVKPTAGTDRCEVAHLGYVIKGRMKTVYRDGTEILMEPGDFVSLPPGHEAWVLGEDPCVLLDFTGGTTYAK